MFTKDDVPLIFAGSPLDRAEHLREDPVWLDQRLGDPESRFILYSEDLRPLMRRAPELDIALVGGDVAAPLAGNGAMWIFLGVQGERAHFGLIAPENAEAAGADSEFMDVRAMAYRWGRPEHDGGRAAMVAQGRALLGWHQRHGFCAVCGGKTVADRGGYVRRCGDAACGAEHFPRTDPVVIMLAIDGERGLVGRQAMFPPGMYSALAGFMEPGESIEEAVRRELNEEAGITTGRVDYVASQPWPFPSSLMIGCFAEATSTDITLDERELEHAQWVSRDDVRAVLAGKEGASFQVPPPMAIARVLLEIWAE